MHNNVLYAQSGGVTAVINTSAIGLINEIQKIGMPFGDIYAGQNGILGILNEELIDVSHSLENNDLKQIYHSPGGVFGSCRYKLPSYNEDEKPYDRLLAICKAHKIGYFFYNGGGDSQDTTNKISQYFKQNNYPICCIGIPKTIDNDLMLTDNCPGFASTAKYVATSIFEAGLDIQSMAKTSTKVFIMEVMGRHTGWIAAATGIASLNNKLSPHIILFPEIPFTEQKFLQKVQECVNNFGYCSIVAAEGIKDIHGDFISKSQNKDAFGHSQLGGVAPYLANLVQQKLQYKNHWAVCDYLQRSARHIAAKVDIEQAYALGQAAAQAAANNCSNIMMAIERVSNEPYSWKIKHVALNEVANHEKKLPAEFLREDNLHINEKFCQYLLPLIQGEQFPPFVHGLPKYFTNFEKLRLITKKLNHYLYS